MRVLALSASLALGASSALLVFACDVEVNNPPPAVPTPPAPPVTTVVVDASPPVAVAGPVLDAGATPTPAPAAPDAAVAAPAPSAPDAGPFYSCNTSADCVAVPKVGCCYNGYNEAVNKQATEAYKSSFVCGKPRPMCPQYMINDTRVPRCSPSLHKCEMVGKGVDVK